MLKVMIIDDNHSFIDSLKVMMKEFAFTYDEFQRYQPAEIRVEKSGPVIHFEQQKKLEKFAQQVLGDRPEKEGKISSKEVLNAISENLSNDLIKDKIRNPINRESGYFLIFVEQNTETNLKGTSFIENQLAQNNGLQPENFVLLTDSPQLIDAKASAMKLPILVKPVKAALLRNFLIERINNFKEKEARTAGLYSIYQQIMDQQLKRETKKLKQTVREPKESLKEKGPAQNTKAVNTAEDQKSGRIGFFKSKKKALAAAVEEKSAETSPKKESANKPVKKNKTVTEPVTSADIPKAKTKTVSKEKKKTTKTKSPKK